MIRSEFGNEPTRFSIPEGDSAVANVRYRTCFNRGEILLIYLDPTGGTVINRFGTSIRSTSVGIVGIFCGAVLVGFAFVRSRRS